MLRQSSGDRLFQAANTTFLLLLVALILYPLLYIVSASVSDPTYVNSGQMWLFPKGFTLEGYNRVFRNADIWTGYMNSIVYTVGGVALNLAVTLPCAYALSRRNLAGRQAFTLFIVFTMFFSGGLIPTYLLVKSLGLVNTYGALILPSAASAINIIVSRTFFQGNVPQEMEEAAAMDGCSDFRLFMQIILPLSKALIAVMALFYGVGHWNQYFNALIYLSNRELYPLQLFLREILVQQEISAQMLTTGSDLEMDMSEQTRISELIKYAVMIIAALPLLIVFPFVQKHFVQGVMIGSLKQ
ncbi:carbohydrate ABC transporter permease [Paenibacillus sp. WQ 127069]|uniref:Carbohydrate ABC transporter permease n=1 Tax=Paenibacillus baimaensis TaxID=2982185 RepID=A0ABT2UC65_9BACL|nr:carbohydrate ABC transporter permease [Paenibacillus sp. WQ 127069]MCU6792225.1 carbohydrate ABC transporter permease [Paenibacillus sp. WQ 127069]